MKILRFFFGLILLMFMFKSAVATDLDFTYNVDTVKVTGQEMISISINIQGGQPEYIIVVFNDYPWKCEKPVFKSRPIDNYIYTIDALNLGRYMVGVIDKNEDIKYKWIE